MKSFNQFKKDTWRNRMNQSKGLDSWSNYSGQSNEAWCNFVVVLGRNRDSNNVEETNFEAALERLGGESKNVHVERFGHWGCGWFELLLVNPRSKKINEAYKITNELKKYPLLNEDSFYDRQREALEEYVSDVYSQLDEKQQSLFIDALHDLGLEYEDSDFSIFIREVDAQKAAAHAGLNLKGEYQ